MIGERTAFRSCCSIPPTATFKASVPRITFLFGSKKEFMVCSHSPCSIALKFSSCFSVQINVSFLFDSEANNALNFANLDIKVR